MWGYQESDAPDADRPFSSKPQNALSFQRERRQRCAVRSAIEYLLVGPAAQPTHWIGCWMRTVWEER
jgi:hypothetical protein